MKFLVDAQLPLKLARLLREAGHDVTHTLELPLRNATSDGVLRDFCAREGRVLVTKNSDFVDSLILRGEPPRLLFVSTGNITNRDLETLFRVHLSTIVTTLGDHVLVELDRNGITIRA